jgi:hypothetical protein
MQVNAQTAFPSLEIPGSSRGFGMGNTGIASATENQQLWYNASKTAFTQNFHQVSINYSPWLAVINTDSRFIHLNYLSTLSNSSSLGFLLGYLDMGDLTTRDNNGAAIATYHAKAFYIGSTFAIQIADKSSLGLGFNFLGQDAFTNVPKNIYGICGSLSYYQFQNLGDLNKKLEWGIVLNNLGPKISLQVNEEKIALPVNLGMGIAYSIINADNGTQSQFGLDVKRTTDHFQYSAGMEFGFAGSFFLRGGVHLESKDNGNRKYFGFGVGYKGFVMDQSWGIDFHYLIPFGAIAAVSPFQYALGFSLKMNLGNFQ